MGEALEELLAGGSPKTGGSTRGKAKSGPSEAERGAEALKKSVESLNEQLDRQIALFSQMGEAAPLRYELENGELAKLLPAQKEELLAKAAQLDYLEGEAKVREDLKQIQGDRDAIDQLLKYMEREQVLLLGTNEERIREIAIRMAGKNAPEEQIVSLERWIKANEKAQQASAQWRDLQANISDSLYGLATDFGNAENIIKDFFDNWAKQITKGIADD